MIRISEEFMGLSNLFVENSFTKRDDSYFYVSTGGDTVQECIKLEPLNSVYTIKPVIVYTKTMADSEGELQETIEGEAELTGESKAEALGRFFKYLSYAKSIQDVDMNSLIVDIISLDNASFYADGDTLIAELFGVMGGLQIKGIGKEGAYNSLVLDDITLVNVATGQEIKYFDKINLLAGFFDIESEMEEDEDIKALISGYFETLTENDIRDIFDKVRLQ